MRVLLCIMVVFSTSLKASECERNVDVVNYHYINGMFTPVDSFILNMDSINKFVYEYLPSFEGSNITGTHNFSEPLFEQLVEVLRQKSEDSKLFYFLNNEIDYELANDPETIAEVQEFLAEVSEFIYSDTLNDGVSREARIAIENHLNTCSRVVLITHSQGNFYGNAIMSDIYSDYINPIGYSLIEYPMLANMQIASPVSTPGGLLAGQHPEIIGHLTNNIDYIMDLVRGTIGSVSPNYDSNYLLSDATGHGLAASYLEPQGQAMAISSDIKRIVNGMRPYPLHGQELANSSALAGFGYTGINDFLDIEFSTGGVYRYSDVPVYDFLNLRNADSQGGYFNQYIRNQYSYEILE